VIRPELQKKFGVPVAISSALGTNDAFLALTVAQVSVPEPALRTLPSNMQSRPLTADLLDL